MSTPGMSQYRKNFKKGEVFLREGETGSQIYYLEKGILDVFVQDRKVNSIDASVSQDFFGEIGAVLGTPRTATVIAATDCVAICLPKIKLETVLKNSPSLGLKLVHSLCKKLVSSLSTLAEFQVKDTSILHSGSTETSLRNYMKGLLHLMELAGKDSSDEAGKNLLDYFLRTNPWGIQHGDRQQILDNGSPEVSTPDEPISGDLNSINFLDDSEDSEGS